MSRPDKNYVSLAGKPDGELWLTDYRQPEGSQTRLLRAPGIDDFLVVDLGDITPAQGWDDALKLSGAVNVSVTVGELHGGAEDCVDINHSRDVAVKIRKAVPRGRFVATIKGGTENAMVTVEQQIGHGRETDFDLGNWADFYNARTTGVHLSARVHDGSPARVRVLHAHVPTLDPAGRWVVSKWLKGFFQKLFTILKRLGLA